MAAFTSRSCLVFDVLLDDFERCAANGILLHSSLFRNIISMLNAADDGHMYYGLDSHRSA